MKVSLVTIGSRGDIQPYLALGQGLQRAGHQPQIVTFSNFAPLVQQHGLPFTPLAGDGAELMRRIVHVGTNNLRFLQAMRGYFLELLDQIMDDIWHACQDSDLIVYHFFALPARHIAERLGIPCVQGFSMPFSRTRAFPNLMSATKMRLGGSYNWLSHALSEYALHFSFVGAFNRWRRRYHLPMVPHLRYSEATQHGKPVPILYSFSEHVLPRPDDWADHIHTCGYWFLDQPDWQPPPVLRDFLASGPPPVFLGFGSIAGTDFARLTQLSVAALRQSGQRGIIQRGWGGLSTPSVSQNLLVIDAAPHDWLFPQMAAVIHHGGAGTTGAGVRAGIPTITVPFFGDQFFWGARLQALGVSPASIPYQQLTAEHLAATINQALGDRQIQSRAAELGAQLRAEDGVGRAIAIIEAASKNAVK